MPACLPASGGTREPTQCRPCGDLANTVVRVGQVGGNGQLARLPYAHVQQPQLPSFNDLALAQGELKGRVVVVARVELGAVALQRALVHHRQLVAILRLARAVDGPCDVDAEVLRKGEGGDQRERERLQAGEWPHGDRNAM